jgi:lincosamide nucleotidyltransferase A/C/D/E
VTAEQLSEINEILLGLHIKFWIAGGWAIDALVGEQTREHHDVDIAFNAQDRVASPIYTA